MRKVLIILFLSLITLTCSGHGVKIAPSNNTAFEKVRRLLSQCESQGPFPQMILIPYFKHATQIVTRCEIYPNHRVSLAMTLFYYNWVENFGDYDYSVKELLRSIMIEWGEKVKVSKQGFFLDGKKFTNHNIIGRVMSPTTIWVYKGEKEEISETAFIHELVHLAIRAQTRQGHGDPDHEGTKYHGWTPAHTRMVDITKGMIRVFSL